MAATARSETSEVKKPAKEVPIVQDQGSFVHETGDKYDGYFEAKKKDKSVKMHGPGLYRSAQGDTYLGIWEYDKLGSSETITVTFPDGSKYEGILKEWQYFGRANYTYPDASVLQCNFVDNCPIGALSLKDPNGHVWLGTSETGFCWFEPVNHYYEMLEGREADIVKEKRRRKKKTEGQIELK